MSISGVRVRRRSTTWGGAGRAADCGAGASFGFCLSTSLHSPLLAMNCWLYSSLSIGKRRERWPLWVKNTVACVLLGQNPFLSQLKCHSAVDQPNMGEGLRIIAELFAGLWIQLLREET
jgi:hypothetical protein